MHQTVSLGSFEDKMPEQLQTSEVNAKTDPSVTKQYDTETPKDQQWKDLYAIIDGKNVTMLNTFVSSCSC